MPVSGIPVKTDLKSGNRVILVTEKMVPISEVDKKAAEIAEKNDIISTLSSKVNFKLRMFPLKCYGTGIYNSFLHRCLITKNC